MKIGFYKAWFVRVLHYVDARVTVRSVVRISERLIFAASGVSFDGGVLRPFLAVTLFMRYVRYLGIRGALQCTKDALHGENGVSVRPSTRQICRHSPCLQSSYEYGSTTQATIWTSSSVAKIQPVQQRQRTGGGKLRTTVKF